MSGKIIVRKYILNSVFFKRLKGLNNVEFEFSPHLTAIMGVNGIGKSTVIHALACMFQPEINSKCINYRFPMFFLPNTDALWSGSEFIATFTEKNLTENTEKIVQKTFGKKRDRWAPQYNTRYSRNVYYLGIQTCVPDIEKINSTSRITYKSKPLDDDTSHEIIEKAKYILNIDYECLFANKVYIGELKGVKTSSGLKYSSISMGTGEQRVITILKTVLNAEKYSLVLIDEIDLLLHVSAVKKMITVLYEIARKRKLQIVFTTHSLEMLSLTKMVKIQYIIQNTLNNEMNILDRITSDLVYDLTEKTEEKFKFYVEDKMSAAILSSLLKKHKILGCSKTVIFGACSNAFTLASSHVLDNNVSNSCYILDGDVYRTDEAKRERINSTLSGTEFDADNKRTQALELITQYNLPEGVSPEKYLHGLILNYFDHDSEEYKYAYSVRNIPSTFDRHGFIDQILNVLNYDEKNLVREIEACCDRNPALKIEWDNYLRPIDEWIERKLCEIE